MSLFASLSRVLPTSSEYSLRSLATCLQAIDPSCTYRAVRARIKAKTKDEVLASIFGDDCGFSIDMLATIVNVCLAKLDESAKRDALAEALNLSRPNNEVTDKADAKVVTAIANNHTAIKCAKAALDNATKVEPLCLEDGTEDATDDDRVINDATNPMTVAIKTAAAYGEDITKAVEFKAYTFESKLKDALRFTYTGIACFACELGGLNSLIGNAIGRKVTNNDYLGSCRYLSFASGCLVPVVHSTEILGVLNKVCTNLSEEAQAKVLPIYKDAITIAWQCVHTDDIDRLTFGQAQSLAAQIQGRFDDLTQEQRMQYRSAATDFILKLVQGAKVIPSDSVECICELNAAQARINERRAKEAAASSQSEAVVEEATEQTAQTTPIAAAATKAAPKAASKTAVEAPVLCVEATSDDEGINTPAEPMGFVYEPAKGICEFDRLDVYGDPVTPQDGFNQGIDVPSTDIHAV